MDLMTGLPAGASQNDAVLVVVDRLMKMAHFAPCRTTITAEQTAKLLISTVVHLHGIPKAIVSDRDPRFTSNFWTKMWEQYGTRLYLFTAYHPLTDGQTEWTNHTMEQLIRTICTDSTQWEDSLPLMEFAYNNAPSSMTAQSPFYLNYGLNHTTPITPLIKSPAPRSQKFAKDLQTAEKNATEAISKANLTAERYADRHRQDLPLFPGQLVLLDTNNLGLNLPH
ncbi:hypothetical protein CLOP_g21093 [Closterium sp. NIES-67]|nr:hypothetical protein CLOP_g21093 [Closterium sp. NIES-67]